MADHSELEHVIVYIRHRIQSYYDSSRRDSISDQIYPSQVNSPTSSGGGRSSSFSQGNSNYSPPTTGVGPNGEFQYASKSVSEYNTNISNDKTPIPVYSTSPTKKKINTITFEKSDISTNTFTFTKEAIPKEITTVQSSLTKLVKPNEEKAKDPWSAYGDFTPPPNEGITLTVFLGAAGPKGLRVRVIKQATVGQCVAATLKTYMHPYAPNITVNNSRTPINNTTPPTPSQTPIAPPSPNPDKPISLDPKHYLFRIADDSGSVDDDYPALDERQLVFKFKDENFILVPKVVPVSPVISAVKPVETVKKPAAVVSAARGGSSQNLDTGAGVALDANGAPIIQRRTSNASMDPPLLLKVRLPDNTSTKVIMQGHLKVGDLLRHVCRKRQLNLEAHTLVLPRSLDPLDLETVLNKLSSDEFMLCPSFLHSPSSSTASPKQRSHTGPSTTPRNAAPINPILPAPTFTNAPITPRAISPSKSNSSNIVYAITTLRSSFKTNGPLVSAKVAATVISNGTPNTRMMPMRSASSLNLSTPNSSATILTTSNSALSFSRPSTTSMHATTSPKLEAESGKEDPNNNTTAPLSPSLAPQDSPSKKVDDRGTGNINDIPPLSLQNPKPESKTTTDTESKKGGDSPTKTQSETQEKKEQSPSSEVNITQKENVEPTNTSVKIVSTPVPISEASGTVSESRSKLVTAHGTLYSYTVFRLRKKQTVKKERILSFNSEKIYNEKVSSRNESFTDNEDRTRNIKNIAKVSLGDKPCQFSIIYDDAKVYFYEAKEHAIAEEIVQKLNELMNTPQSPKALQ
eukprot:TRINITY_DN5540_c0_g1_i2.p1 TRINITY_DN5540_c0_g1~~TRINITY_DN5540_c0_g1_i2.p1  ORF type:complete len:802 (-),score=194.53 TRINITY_DN5540_c0_g1_i2:193-2598(-)